MQSTLWAHPACPSTAIERIEVSVERRSATSLSLRYVTFGRIADIAVPPPAPLRRTDNLWRTTCFEAFLRPHGLTAYREFNFSPSGAWAAYAFTARRTGMVQAAVPGAPEITLTRSEDRLDLDVLLSLDLPREPYALALTAVIQEGGGAISYWAAAHPGGSDGPDFHHPSCFVDQLPPAPAP